MKTKEEQNRLCERADKLFKNLHNLETIEHSLFQEYEYWSDMSYKDDAKNYEIERKMANDAIELHEEYKKYSKIALDEYSKALTEWLNSMRD